MERRWNLSMSPAGYPPAEAPLPEVPLDPPALAVLAVVGVVAGFVNTLAGGGSLLTLPALIFLGLPAATANGTNRIGVLVQSATAASRFHTGGLLDVRSALRLAPATLVGAGAGAWASLQLGEVGLRRAMVVVMVLVLGLLWLRPKRWLVGGGRQLPLWAAQLVFVAIGFYGGFIQAGVGVLLLVGLVLAQSQDLVRANATKVFLVVIFTLPAVAIFAIQGAVAWLPGLVLATGSALGAMIGARLAIRGGTRLIRWALTVVVLASCVRLWAA